MPAKLNLIGQTFGRLTVISEAPKKGKLTAWRCLCSCGNEITVATGYLNGGRVRSCGCARKDSTRALLTVHGLTGTRLHNIWKGMLDRCYRAKNKSYKNYGARGIKVCAAWEKDFTAFHAWALGSGYSDGLTIDRIDNAGDYSPDNCRWVSRTEQNRNKRSNLTYKGKCVAEWAAELGAPASTIYQRVQLGWSIEAAITTPRLTQWSRVKRS